MCVTDRHDMTLAVKVALNPNTTYQIIFCHEDIGCYSTFLHAKWPCSSKRALNESVNSIRVI